MPDNEEQVEVVLLDHPKLRDTGNGPDVSYEEDLLREWYGEPDEEGVYGREASSDES